MTNGNPKNDECRRNDPHSRSCGVTDEMRMMLSRLRRHERTVGYFSGLFATNPILSAITSGSRNLSIKPGLRRALSFCSSPLIASLEASWIYRAATEWRNLLIIGFGQNQVQIWEPRKSGDQQRGLNQLGKIDILRLRQLCRTGAHHYHLPGVERSSLARMMFERHATVAFEDYEFDHRFGA